jgi:hypothetical protein
MQDAPYVHFVELAGSDARERLARQAERWRAGGVTTTLLRHEEQSDLWLLVGWAAAPPGPAVLPGARTWRFRAPADERT